MEKRRTVIVTTIAVTALGLSIFAVLLKVQELKVLRDVEQLLIDQRFNQIVEGY